MLHNYLCSSQQNTHWKYSKKYKVSFFLITLYVHLTFKTVNQPLAIILTASLTINFSRFYYRNWITILSSIPNISAVTHCMHAYRNHQQQCRLMININVMQSLSNQSQRWDAVDSDFSHKYNNVTLNNTFFYFPIFNVIYLQLC